MTFQLRPPQLDLQSDLRAAYAAGKRRVLVSAPTGFGKTILAHALCAGVMKTKRRVLFTAHRIQLAEQTFKKFADLKPSFLQGNSEGYDHENLIQVATLQTVINREIETPFMVIIDEVHYAYDSKLVQSLFERFPDAFFIGLSATPVDDSGNLLEGFDAILDKYQTGDLIEMGWLVPFKIFSPVAPDLSEVKVVAGEYEEAGVLAVIKRDNITASAVDNYIKYGENRKFIAFAVNQAHAAEVHAEFASRGIKTAVIISKTPDNERKQALFKIKTGEIQGLINVEILTAGFDEETIKLVMLLSPTKSWKKYIQCCGRGIRLLGNSISESIERGKPDCILLDCAGAVAEHDLPDKRKVWKFKKKISRVVDRELGIDELVEGAQVKPTVTIEKQVYLKQIGSLLDLYEGKVYSKEADLQEDINSFLKKTGYFWYRQNSGKAFIQGRWVHFANKNGLPDNKIYFRMTSFSFWFELKLPKGTLTPYQKETLPEMVENKVLFFIVESVMDAYRAIEHVEFNLLKTEDGLLIRNSIYELSERQIQLRNRLKIPMYGN